MRHGNRKPGTGNRATSPELGAANSGLRILGIDPGTATTGFGLIEKANGKIKFLDAGVISTPSTEKMPDRLNTVFDEMCQLIDEHKPDEVAVELLYFAANVTTAMTVGQARGVVILAAAKAGLPISEYTPLQVKMAVTGYGRADKKQIQEMVKTILKLDQIPKPDDAADGLAIAITHSNQTHDPSLRSVGRRRSNLKGDRHVVPADAGTPRDDEGADK